MNDDNIFFHFIFVYAFSAPVTKKDSWVNYIMDHDSRDISKMRNVKQELHEWPYPFISKTLLLEIALYI